MKFVYCLLVSGSPPVGGQTSYRYDLEIGFCYLGFCWVQPKQNVGPVQCNLWIILVSAFAFCDAAHCISKIILISYICKYVPIPISFINFWGYHENSSYFSRCLCDIYNFWSISMRNQPILNLRKLPESANICRLLLVLHHFFNWLFKMLIRRCFKWE